MSNQPAPNQRFTLDVPYKVGEECSYWLNFGEYVQRQATEDGLLVDGKLTLAGLQAIVSEREMAKKRDEKTSAIKLKAQSKKGKTKARRISFKTRFSSKTKKQTRSGFVDEVKALLAKIGGKFVHFSQEGEVCRLVVRIPNEKGNTTSRTLSGAVSDIKRELDGLIEQYD